MRDADPYSPNVMPTERDETTLEQLTRHFVWRADATGSLTYLNARFSAFTGRTLEQCLGDGWAEAVAAPWREDVGTRWREAVAHATPFEAEIPFIGTDGQVRWHQGRGLPVRAESGEVTHWVGVGYDIHDAVEKRELHAAARGQLQSIVDHAPALMFIKERRGRYELINRAFLTLFGLTDTQVIGRTDAEIFDAGTADQFTANAALVWRTGEPNAVEERVPGRDGERIFLSEKFLLRDGTGQPVGLCGIAVDITEARALRAELEHAQQRLDVALAAGRMAVWEWHPRTGEAHWNSEMYRLLALPNDGSVTPHGELFVDRIHPADRAAFDAAIGKALADCSPYEQQFRLVRYDGRVVWLAARAAVVCDAQGRARSMMGVNYDVTTIKEAEIALREADVRRNEFLAMLGHELRNPIAPITNAVRLLERGLDAAEPRSMAVQILRRQVGQLARLVDDLLEVSRITRGRIELRPEHVLVASVVLAAVESVRPALREHRQTIDIDAPVTIDVVADPARITQIVANLLTNASKYSPDGAHIRVDVRADDGWVEISVADNGKGIEPDLLPHVFDLFRQGPRTLDRAEGGLGLGLALVKQLTALHGGSIRAESPGPGQGSVFTLRLPRTARRAEPRGAAAELPAPALDPMSFLVVDDNKDAAGTFRLLLEGEGHRVRVAHDGDEAIAVARAFAPRVVLLDIGLPGRNGYEVARALRAEDTTRDAVIIVVSGYGESTERARQPGRGIDAHLLKPADLADIYRAVSKAIRAQQ